LGCFFLLLTEGCSSDSADPHAAGGGGSASGGHAGL